MSRFLSCDVYLLLLLLQGDFWLRSKHVCQSVQWASSPVGRVVCVRRALRAACSVSVLSAAAAVRAFPKLCCSCRTGSVFQSASGQGWILIRLIHLCLPAVFHLFLFSDCWQKSCCNLHLLNIRLRKVIWSTQNKMLMDICCHDYNISFCLCN